MEELQGQLIAQVNNLLSGIGNNHSKEDVQLAILQVSEYLDIINKEYQPVMGAKIIQMPKR